MIASALLAANSDVYAELYCGVPASGRAIVPLNSRWAVPELAYADAGASILIADQDAGELAECVDRVISFDEYEQLLQESSPKEFADTSEADLAGLFIPVVRQVRARASCSRIATSSRNTCIAK